MKKLSYLEQGSTLTLRDAVQELRQAEGADGDATEWIAPELVTDIELHDVIHTVFACPTNLRGEIFAHLWSIFGTTLEMGDMHRVNAHKDHKAVLRQIGHKKLLITWVKSLPFMLRIIWRSLKMKCKWPANEFEKYLDTPLVHLRTEFNIEVLRSHSIEKKSKGAALRSIRASQRENVV